MEIETLKHLLGLKPLPDEGGFYAETYRSEERLAKAGLPERYAADRCASTAIYYLLTPDTFSALHRLKSDETYHFYLGDPVELFLLQPGGAGESILLGPDLSQGMKLQFTVPHGTWQGSHLVSGGKFALLGTTTAPGFEFADFELARPDALLAGYPHFTNLIRSLTR